MALPTINLDDRTFDQLFAFMRKQIDTGQWSDHNYSDPGIVLLDLLCWIGEMVLYRANRVPDAHVAKFADLILDPPEPVTVSLTLTAPARTTDVTVPAGTRFATDFRPATAAGRARRFVFETIEPALFRAPHALADTQQERVVTARERLAVENETLGVSTGLPNQTFALRPVHTDLGLPLDAPAPVLLDFVHRSASYDPNPRVTVAGLPWELKQFLLTGESWIDPAAVNPPSKPHYMVEPDGRVRFGDGTFGSIPPAGAAIVCSHYQLLQGPDALISADSLVHQLDAVAGLTANESISKTNGAGEGGGFFFRPEERLTEGLRRFRHAFRLVTSVDVEQVMLIDFNEAQVLGRAPDRVLRAVARMNRKPQSPAAEAPGHVSIVVLAAQHPARGHLSFSAQPAANSAIDLNGTTWTFVPGTPSGNQTRIGADMDATVIALAADLNASSDGQVRHCTYTADTAADRLEIQFDTAGPAGNRFTLTSSATSNGTVSAPTLTGGDDFDAALTARALSNEQKQALVDLAPALIDKIGRFLDRRRLITTRVHVESPAVIGLSITAQVAVFADRNDTEMKAVIEQRVRAFLGVVRGGLDGKGWPVGQSLHRSEVFRFVEDIDGVDHVEALTLTPADANGDVSIGPLSIPALSDLRIDVTRA